MRKIALLVLGVLSVAAPASAKGPALTWEVQPSPPTAGEAGVLVLQLWDWTADGEPDLTSPWTYGSVGVNSWSVFTYPARAFPQRGPRRIGKPNGPWVRVDRARYETSITFARAGEWVIAQRDPYSHYYPDWRVLEVQVGARRDAWRHDPKITEPRAPTEERSTDTRAITAGTVIGGLLLTGALLQRRRRREAP